MSETIDLPGWVFIPAKEGANGGERWRRTIKHANGLSVCAVIKAQEGGESFGVKLTFYVSKAKRHAKVTAGGRVPVSEGLGAAGMKALELHDEALFYLAKMGAMADGVRTRGVTQALGSILRPGREGGH